MYTIMNMATQHLPSVNTLVLLRFSMPGSSSSLSGVVTAGVALVVVTS